MVPETTKVDRLVSVVFDIWIADWAERVWLDSDYTIRNGTDQTNRKSVGAFWNGFVTSKDIPILP